MKYRRDILPSGIRLITVPRKDHPTVTVMVLVEAGSKYETKDISGISHFLEHMCFKGTKKRPTALDISKELDGIGAAYNAFTAQEFTGYFAKSDFKHFDKTLDVVSDIYLHSTLPEAEIEKEKGVIVEEINLYEDRPERRVQDQFTSLLYGDTPAGWDIAGSKVSVRAVTRAKLSDYRNKHYVASATAVIITGNFDEASVAEKVSKIFSAAASGEKHGKEKVVEAQDAPKASVFFKETDQSHFVLGARTFDVYDKRNPILRVLSTVLGGGMSSRLFQRIREELGAAYYVGAAAEPFSDHGFFEIAAGVDQSRVREVLDAVMGEIRRVRDEKVSDHEIRKAKDYLIGSMYLSLETSDGLADIYGYQEIMRKPLKTPDEIGASIEAVTAEEVQTLAKSIFKTEALNLALIGRFRDEAEFLPALAL